MPLVPGTRLGPYEILSPLGAGGMGEVYLARDTRLGREVAVKVLPQHLTANDEVRARFEREAKTVSSLNHPNICSLFDVGREGETDYLVMERIEGQTLAERLSKGPMATPELLRTGAQIADALDRAHRAGVVHRDLKPGNVMLTKTGAKLMDFGLARATGMAGPASGSGATVAALTQSPTIAHALTAEGTIVGTFQYMSPEQLEGKEADARSDIWALGCVLYEMATGRRAFEGRSQASLIAAILEREPAGLADAPSGASTPGSLPHGLERLIRACLTKDPDERIQTAHDVRLQLQWIADGAGVSSIGVAVPAPVAGAATVRPARARLAWSIAAAALALAAGVFVWLWPRANAPRPLYRFRTEPLARVSDYFWPRVSPDGRTLLFESTDSSGANHVWLQPLDQAEGHPIAGAEGLQRAYWSPDSREIAFVAGSKVQRLGVAGGAPVVVCEAHGGADLSWGSRGMILMDADSNDSLAVVPARGGELRPATRIVRSAGEQGSAWPCFLPDGEHFLYIGTTGTLGGNIRLGKLGSLDSKLLGHSDGRVEIAPDGWVLYLKGTTLLAQKLDLGAGRLTGQPLTIAEDVRTGSSQGHFSISASGVFAYSRAGQAGFSSLFLADRGGRLTGGALTTGLLTNPEISPDGRRLLFERSPTTPGAQDEIWVHDLERGTETRLTFVEGAAKLPVWSPDSRRFACVIRPRTGAQWLMVGSADGLGAVDTITAPGTDGLLLSQWSAFGSDLVVDPGNYRGLLVANPDSATHVLRPVSGITNLMAHAAISPDGHWLAYATSEGSPTPEVFVQSLVGAPGRWQISTSFGIHPVWVQGGRELLFESDAGIMAVEIDTQGGFQAGSPKLLFEPPTRTQDVDKVTWGSSADGQRFALLAPLSQTTVQGNIEVVTDFRSLVNRR